MSASWVPGARAWCWPARRGLEVLSLESGGRRFERRPQALNQADVGLAANLRVPEVDAAAELPVKPGSVIGRSEARSAGGAAEDGRFAQV
jgi:hypothetical protein